MATEITAHQDREVVIGWPAFAAAVVVAVPWYALLFATLSLWCIAWMVAYASVAPLIRDDRALDPGPEVELRLGLDDAELDHPDRLSLPCFFA